MKLPIAILALTSSTTAFAPPSAPHIATSLAAVSKKDTYHITLLPGDGIGPEIMASCKEVLGALTKRCGFTLEMKEALIGGVAIDEAGDPFPDESLEQCLKSDSVLLRCIGGYKVSIYTLGLLDAVDESCCAECRMFDIVRLHSDVCCRSFTTWTVSSPSLDQVVSFPELTILLSRETHV